MTGTLRPEELVKLTSEEVANQELRAQAEKIREEGVAQSVLKVQSGPRIRRTHKGEEIVEDEVSAITPTEGTASAPFARDIMSPSVKGDGEQEVPASPRSNESNRSRSFSPQQMATDTIPEGKQSTFDIQNGLGRLPSVSQESDQTDKFIRIEPYWRFEEAPDPIYQGGRDRSGHLYGHAEHQSTNIWVSMIQISTEY